MSCMSEAERLNDILLIGNEKNLEMFEISLYLKDTHPFIWACKTIKGEGGGAHHVVMYIGRGADTFKLFIGFCNEFILGN